MAHPGVLHPESLPLKQAIADPYLHRRHSDTQRQVCFSICGVSCMRKVLFDPSERLWQVWGLILNTISSLLPSCWGFSCALGCGISFFGRIQHSPVDDCSAVSCNFGNFAGEDTQSPLSLSIGKQIV